jgi:5,10-methylene-tetrahydrofolate dehydrogenase/methenyl tetrahydrofolate cyclohydrolase
MAAAAFEFGFVSDGLVGGMVAEQIPRLNYYSPNPPKLGVILGFPHADNRSYGLQTLYHASMLTEGQKDTAPPVELFLPTAGGFDVVSTPDEYFAAKGQGLYSPQSEREKSAHDDRIFGLTQDLNYRRDISGILVLSPTATKEGDSRIAAIIAPQKDVDGAAPHGKTTRATPEAALLMGEYMAGKRLGPNEKEDVITPEQIGCVGYGPRVMKPLVDQVLPARRGIHPDSLGVHLKTTPEIAEGLPKLHEREIKIIFIALPVGAILLSEHVNDGTVIVDMGQGWSTDGSMYAGNAHPELVARHNPNGSGTGVKVNGLRRSGGAATTGVVFDRTIPQIGDYPANYFTPDMALAAR